jgi:hypothetical protein
MIIKINNPVRHPQIEELALLKLKFGRTLKISMNLKNLRIF